MDRSIESDVVTLGVGARGGDASLQLLDAGHAHPGSKG